MAVRDERARSPGHGRDTWRASKDGCAGALVDTGALYAFVDVNDRGIALHACIAAARLPLVTTAAVLTEMFYFIVKRKKSDDAAWQLLRSGQIEVSANR